MVPLVQAKTTAVMTMAKTAIAARTRHMGVAHVTLFFFVPCSSPLKYLPCSALLARQDTRPGWHVLGADSNLTSAEHTTSHFTGFNHLMFLMRSLFSVSTT